MGAGADDEPPAADSDARQTILDVHISGVHSDKGEVLVALFRSEKGFPDDVEHALRRGVARLEGSQAYYSFGAIPSGVYAVSVLHDEDGNHKMKTGFFGQPKEGWCVSRNAHSTFAPPAYEDAAFSAEGDSILIELQLRY
jgi:uncharacterized protein (DUF2141 family)